MTDTDKLRIIKSLLIKKFQEGILVAKPANWHRFASVAKSYERRFEFALAQTAALNPTNTVTLQAAISAYEYVRHVRVGAELLSTMHALEDRPNTIGQSLDSSIGTAAKTGAKYQNLLNADVAAPANTSSTRLANLALNNMRDCTPENTKEFTLAAKEQRKLSRIALKKAITLGHHQSIQTVGVTFSPKMSPK